MQLDTLDPHGNRARIDVEDKPFQSGGEAAVYLSVDKQYVVKLYHKPPKSKRAEALRKILASQPPPHELAHLAWVLRLVVDGDTVRGVVMRYLSGMETLSRAIRTQSGDRQQRLTCALAFVGAVRYLHRSGFGHGDISPNNILVNVEAGQAALIDLDGLNVIEQGELMGGVLGTPGYIAPEVADQKMRPNRMADRFALAIVLYEFLVGEHPLPGDNDAAGEVYREHVDNTSATCRAWSNALCDLFEKAFIAGRNQPDVRPKAADFERALYQLRTVWVHVLPHDVPSGVFVRDDVRTFQPEALELGDVRLPLAVDVHPDMLHVTWREPSPFTIVYHLDATYQRVNVVYGGRAYLSGETDSLLFVNEQQKYLVQFDVI